jgi:hypothetical protein
VVPASRVRPSVSSLQSAGTVAVVQMVAIAASPEGITAVSKKSSDEKIAVPSFVCPVTTLLIEEAINWFLLYYYSAK